MSIAATRGLSARPWAALALGLALGTTSQAVDRSVEQQPPAGPNDATGSQPGRIEVFNRGLLEMKPYNPQSNLTRFWIADDTPVFYGAQQETISDLRSGTDIRVDFRRRPDGTAEATGVVVLSPIEAGAAQMEAQGEEPERQVTPDGINVPPISPMTQVDQVRKESALSNATGSESGTVTANQSGQLVIKPLHEARNSASFKLDAGVPVYNGSVQVGTNAVMPGQDVRVYYNERNGHTEPGATSIEILGNEERLRFETPSGTGP